MANRPPKAHELYLFNLAPQTQPETHHSYFGNRSKSGANPCSEKSKTFAWQVLQVEHSWLTVFYIRTVLTNSTQRQRNDPKDTRTTMILRPKSMLTNSTRRQCKDFKDRWISTLFFESPPKLRHAASAKDKTNENIFHFSWISKFDNESKDSQHNEENPII